MTDIQDKLKTVVLKPVHLNAIRTTTDNIADIGWWLGAGSVTTQIIRGADDTVFRLFQGDAVFLEGRIGDWIVKGADGLSATYSDTAFNQTFDVVEGVETELPGEPSLPDVPEETLPSDPQIPVEEEPTTEPEDEVIPDELEEEELDEESPRELWTARYYSRISEDDTKGIQDFLIANGQQILYTDGEEAEQIIFRSPDDLNSRDLNPGEWVAVRGDEVEVYSRDSFQETFGVGEELDTYYKYADEDPTSNDEVV